jgi:Flp pilus assembly protein TadG
LHVKPADFIKVSGPPGRRGHASVLVVVAIPSVLLMCWMGVQIGFAVKAGNQAQMAADTAALAAAARHADGVQAKNQDALAAAEACAGPNGPVSISVVDAPGGGGDVEFGQWNATTRVFTPDAEGGPAVRVTVRFAADNANGAPSLLNWDIFRSGSAPAFTRRSIAVYTPPTHAHSLLLTSADAGALDVDGSATVKGRGGIYVASPVPGSVLVRGAVRQGETLDVPVLRLAGGIDEVSRDAVAGSIEEGVTVPADPMAGVILPPIDGAASGSVTNPGGGTLRVAPGAHEELSVAAGTVILEAGLHQFTQSVELSGSAVLVLEDAAIELAPAASVLVSGSASITGTGIESGDWQGFWLIQRGAASAWNLAGSASVDVDGGAYGPEATLTISNEARFVSSLGILGRVRVEGTSFLYADQRIEALDLPVVPGRARLVR